MQVRASTPVATGKMSARVQRAVEAMGDLLDRYFSESFYQVDSLSVQLDVKQEDLPRLETLLQEALKQKIEAIAPVKQSTSKPERLQQLSSDQYAKKLAIHFLRAGRLPWWAQSAAMEEIARWLENIQAAEWKTIMKREIERSDSVLGRLAKQFPDVLVRQLIRKSYKHSSQADEVLSLLAVIKAFTGQLDLPYGQREKLMRRLHVQALRAALHPSQDGQEITANLIATVLQAVQTDEDISKWKQWLKENGHPSQWTTQMDEMLGRGKESVGEHSTENAEDSDDQSVEEENFAVGNAGLVLLHPFIETLFENLGLLENDTFRNKDVRERAVCLLHHLCCGGDEFPEHELLFAKFLCGWPFSKPVDRFLPISEYEKQECRSVLESAVDHWDALKNTSVEELRSGFLMREGILKKESFGWSLYLEEQAQDVLLEQLPWGLSVIKLKWMDEMLTVQWRS